MDLILASGSPRRKEILEQFDVSFRVVVSDARENSLQSDPCRLVEELSEIKGQAVLEKLRAAGELTSDTVILSSDTVVATENEILGKPKDEADARRMLRLLSGRSHRVISGICLTTENGSFATHEVTEVLFDELNDELISRYLQSEKTSDKAGAYAIQGKASRFISGIRGDYFNVVGLPMHKLCEFYEEVFGKPFL